jgi:hypothetical protein
LRGQPPRQEANLGHATVAHGRGGQVLDRLGGLGRA